MARKEIQVFNMSFLDMMTNFLGAVIILFLLAAQNVAKAPGVVRKLEGSFDPDRLIIHSQAAGVKVGDTLMLIVTDEQPVYKFPGNIAGGVTRQRIVIRDTIPSGPVTQQPEGILIESAETSECNDAGTPANAADDTYTIALKMVKTGKPGVGFIVDGKTFPYNSIAALGPYKIKDGKRRITIRDAQNILLTKQFELNPPQPCGKQTTPVQTPAGPVAAMPSAPGVINFYLDWEDPSDKVNIYVKKGKSWVFGGRTSDPKIGEFSEFQSNAGPMKRKNTNVETVRQMNNFIPGVYEIHAHYRGNKNEKSDKATVPVVLWLINKKHPNQSQKFEFSIPLTNRGPRNGGGKLLRTVEITQDGQFIIR